jgi:PAS domain S-box-containing protein
MMQGAKQISPRYLDGRKLSAESSVVLLLDTDGRVQTASAAAHALWQATATELVNEYFPNLFTFDVVSRESGWVQSQWEVLLSVAQGQPATLKLQPKEAAPHDAVVRIEKVGDEPVRYFAFISLPAPVVAPQPRLVTVSPFATAATTSDSFLHQLYERSPLGFFDLNFVKKEIYYSPAWKRMLGYADAALPNTYDSWLALIHPDDSTAAPDHQGRGGTTGTRPFSLEFRMKHAQGHYVWVQSVGLQLYGLNGALQRVMGAHLDITDRKDFEEASLRAEERLQQLADRGRVGVFDLDFSDGLCWLSPGFKSLLGYDESDLPDTLESFFRILPKDESTGGTQAYFLARHPNQAAYFDTLRLCHRQGHDVLVHAGIVRHISRRKGLQRVLGFAMPMPDGQAAVSAEAGLRLPAAHLAALLSEIHEGVLIADAGGQVVFLNAKAEQLLGRTTQRCRHQRASEVFHLLHRISGLPGENPVDKALITGDATSLTAEFALDIGGPNPVPVTFSARALCDTAGKPNGAVVVFRNPEEMSLTPEELVRSNRFEALGQLASGVAHDFNNLLTTILGGISLAKDTLNSSGLPNSERACIVAKGLSKQLLTYSKGGTAVRQIVKPTDILGDAVRLAAAGSAVKIELNIAPEIFNVCVDRAQMLQVFQNLIINGIQAMPTGQGHIWITASNVKQHDTELLAALPSGNYVSIEVRDDGSGIPPEHLGKIFAPFFTTKKTGTGLGLATVLSIVKNHGGQIGIASVVGVGTGFTICLPQADKPEEIEARRAPTTLRFGTGRILFMDDDEDISALTGGMLEELGYKFDLARNGEQAVQLYKRYLTIGRPYDAVIMDLTIIGGMGGEQTFKILRELDPEVRAIIASGYDVDEMARQYLDMGFCGYLTKPYRIGDLGKIVRTVLGK